MKILITGAQGFVGKNLVAMLECIRDGKDKVHNIDGLGNPEKLQIATYDVNSSLLELDEACRDCSFVFHLAGVNRPDNPEEFMIGNFGFSSILLATLKKYHNTCPVMLASSVQATLVGRYTDSEYGKSKLAGEKLFFDYAEETGGKVLVYRFPNLFGKWCRPNYNSVVATFCYNIANGFPISVHDTEVELQLTYIDDVLEELLGALNGKEHRCEFEGLQMVERKDGKYCYVSVSHMVSVGEIADLLYSFQEQPQTQMMSEIPKDSFAKKLYSTYLSYLPEEKIKFPLKMNVDERGSFTELLKTKGCGQFSVNISKPGVTKGQHWHHTKWELFIVVSGHGLVQERKIGKDENGKAYPVVEFEVSGEKMEAVHTLPGYVHNLINLSDTQDLVTIVWANEQFDGEHPDTFREIVGIEELAETIGNR